MYIYTLHTYMYTRTHHIDPVTLFIHMYIMFMCVFNTVVSCDIVHLHHACTCAHTHTHTHSVVIVIEQILTYSSKIASSCVMCIILTCRVYQWRSSVQYLASFPPWRGQETQYPPGVRGETAQGTKTREYRYRFQAGRDLHW